MDRVREVELKLEVEPSAARAAAAVLGEGTTNRLLATYYDTPGGSLRARGISFRVRRSAEGYVQTVKVARGAGAGFFDRAEWERPLDSDEPDLSAIDEAGLHDALDKPKDWKKLQPVFTVDVKRTMWRTALDGGSAEVVLDKGSVLANGVRTPILELELELEQGAAAALFGLARRIAGAAPFRVGVLTKAERGYRLLDGNAERPTKAEPMRLPAGATTAEAFAAIVQACLRHFRLNEPLVGQRDAGGLHQSRVALRRLRSAISLFRKVIADERTEAIKSELRGLAATLGDARNLDVLLDRIASDHDGGVVYKIRQAREAAYDRALAALDSERSRALMLDVLEWAEVGSWRTSPPPSTAILLDMPALDFASDVLKRYRRRVKKRGAGLATLDAEHRHHVRIDAKKLRYASEFFASLFDGKKDRRRAKTFLSALEELQASLGGLNDIATGETLAKELAAQGIDLPADIADADEARLLRDAETAHKSLVKAKPFWH